MSRTVVLFALPWFCGMAPRASAQKVLLDVAGVRSQGQASYAIPIGDWDGDGVDDLAVGAPNDDAGAALGGAVRIHSGADGSVLAKNLMKQAGARLGFPLARMPDVDGDGIDDLAVAAPNYDYGGSSKGSIFLYSGGTNQFLLRIDPAMGSVFPMGPAGDVDGDGIGDLFTSRSGVTDTVAIHSCADGREIAHFSGTAHEGFGRTVSVLDDLDGDGVQDLLVGAPFHLDSLHREIGAAYVISTATGTLLRTHKGKFDREYLGVGSTRLEDLDGDGVRDYAVIAAYDGVGNGAMFFVFSGATGTKLANVLSPDPDHFFRERIFDAGDVNGDGFRDVVVEGIWRDSRKNWHGAAFVISGKTWLELGRIEDYDTTLLVGPSFDLDRDGRSDLVVGTLEASLDGRVRVFSGDDLWLTATPPIGSAGGQLDLATAEGVPGGATILVVEAIDGVTTFQLIDGLGVLDAAGHRVVSKSVPSGLGGHTITLRAFATDALGRVIRSAKEKVQL